MKIGILTLPFNNNYGGYLQCYALMTVLKQIGYDVELINRMHNRRTLKYRTNRFLKNIIRSLLCRRIVSIVPNMEKELRYRGQNMMTFVDSEITPKTLPLYSSNEFNRFIDGRYDAIVVGSDQLWRPNYVPNIKDFFLADARNIKKIAYAASFGTEKPGFSETERRDCGIAISDFHAISVREKSAVNVINDFGWKCSSPTVVLDPTLLLPKEHYLKFISKEKLDGYIVCYILDLSKEKEEYISAFAKNKGMKVSYILNKNDYRSPYYKMPSIQKWLSEIRNSKVVITDSYHGTVFSIIFEKPFLFIGNNKRGNTRVDSLFDLLDIDATQTLNLNYAEISDKIEYLKQKSIMFLKKSLS